MAVLALYRFRGDPDELMDAYERASQHELARGVRGVLSHTCAAADDGLVVSEMWASEEALRSFVDDPRFAQALEESGPPAQQPEVLEVRRSAGDPQSLKLGKETLRDLDPRELAGAVQGGATC